jgi:hypothetical protein
MSLAPLPDKSTKGVCAVGTVGTTGKGLFFRVILRKTGSHGSR